MQLAHILVVYVCVGVGGSRKSREIERGKAENAACIVCAVMRAYTPFGHTLDTDERTFVAYGLWDMDMAAYAQKKRRRRG